MFKYFASLITTALAIILIMSQSACRKDVLDTNPASKLSFSVDTVYFDTVFVTLGSVTQRFKIYNNSKDKIKISRIKLEGGSSSPFRLNIDGFPSDDLTDLEIEGEDSAFVFAEVTIDPNNQLNPFIVEDSIRFKRMETFSMLSFWLMAEMPIFSDLPISLQMAFLHSQWSIATAPGLMKNLK